MTIGDVIRYFEDMRKTCSCGTEQTTIAIETMRKYQKIQEIYERFQKDGNYYHHMAWLDVVEVIEDENGNSY